MSTATATATVVVVVAVDVVAFACVTFLKRLIRNKVSMSINAQRFLISLFALRRPISFHFVNVCVCVSVYESVSVAFAQEVGYGKMSNNTDNNNS